MKKSSDDRQKRKRMEFRVVSTKRNGKSLLLDGYKFRFHQTVGDKKRETEKWRIDEIDGIDEICEIDEI